jgi:hypothetical protein
LRKMSYSALAKRARLPTQVQGGAQGLHYIQTRSRSFTTYKA